MSSEMDAPRPFFERIIREEVRQALKTEIRRHRFTEAFVDPASGKLS